MLDFDDTGTAHHIGSKSSALQTSSPRRVSNFVFVSHTMHERGSRDDRLSRWVTGIATGRHPNVAAVALANKTARMAWAMLRNETDYDPDFAIS